MTAGHSYEQVISEDETLGRRVKDLGAEMVFSSSRNRQWTSEGEKNILGEQLAAWMVSVGKIWLLEPRTGLPNWTATGWSVAAPPKDWEHVFGRSMVNLIRRALNTRLKGLET